MQRVSDIFDVAFDLRERFAVGGGRNRRLKPRAKCRHAKLLEQLIHDRIDLRVAVREHLCSGLPFSSSIGRKASIEVRRNHLQGDCILRWIVSDRLRIDAAFAAFAAFSTFAALSPGIDQLGFELRGLFDGQSLGIDVCRKIKR